MTDLTQFSPTMLWRHFNDILRIPRPSGHEQAIREHIQAFAEHHSLTCSIDQVGNVLLAKPATPGFEHKPVVVLQGHLDMVPQKASDKNHDFIRDPITPVIDGVWVTADGTTLGADNGMGIAAALAVMEDKSLRHGPVEALFTVDEEDSMMGAESVSSEWLSNKTILNLDTEVEGHLYAGCAGGINITAVATYQPEPVPEEYQWYQISMSGLLGGHSGIDIHKKRGNAILLMARFLKTLKRKVDYRLGAFVGGELDNVIPSEAVVSLAIPAAAEQKVAEQVSLFIAVVKNELRSNADHFNLTIQSSDNNHAVPEQLVQQWLSALVACPDGPFSFDWQFGGETETSSNLGVLKLSEGRIQTDCFSRSMIDSESHDLADRIGGLFELIGADVEVSGFFPGWQPRLESPVLAHMKQVYQELFDKEPEVRVIHGGLECGIFAGLATNTDMISFGPTITGAHSPRERVNIVSVEKYWQLLVKTLENYAVGRFARSEQAKHLSGCHCLRARRLSLRGGNRPTG